MYEYFSNADFPPAFLRGINNGGGYFGEQGGGEEKEDEKDKMPNRSRSHSTRVMPKSSFLRGGT
jgi:hypothetical protein